MRKRLQKIAKNRVPGNLELMVLLKRVAKKNDFHLGTKNSRNRVRNVFKIAHRSIKYRSGRKDEKTTKKTQKNNTNCTKKKLPRVSHERGFRILKCIQVGFRTRWAPSHPQTAPRHLQTTICCSFVCHLAWFVVDSWCIFSKTKIAMFLLFGVRSGMHFFNKTLEHWKWNKQVGWRAADILGTGAGLPKAIG